VSRAADRCFFVCDRCGRRRANLSRNSLRCVAGQLLASSAHVCCACRPEDQKELRTADGELLSVIYAPMAQGM